MKRTILVAAALLAAAALADDKPAPPLGPKAEKIIANALPVCSEETSLKRTGLMHKLPPNMTGNVIEVASKRPWCAGQWVAITSEEGGVFLGIPWFLDEQQGTIEEKLKDFSWKNMKQAVVPVVERQKTREGLYKVTLMQTTENGKMPLEGEVDPSGSIFFLGHFAPLSGDIRAMHLKTFDPFVAKAPVTGAAAPRVTVIEFSDFECPSCQHAASYMKPILAAHPDKVRYVRYDLPLVSMHPWAFSAAVAGRAVYRQKPDLFWTFKERVYENQEKLSAFTIDDFTRGFAQDHELDMKKYDADVASPELRAEILNGAGTAFSNDIRSTPTYLVNGVSVDPGNEGKALAEYVEKLLQ